MKNNDFEYRYSAPTNAERREIESIRNSYISKPNTIDKLSYLRKLDAKVKNIPTVISLVAGIIGTLTFGLGLSMILEWEILLGGVVVGTIGFIIAILAYPIFIVATKYMKNKYSNEILKLTDELLNEQK